MRRAFELLVLGLVAAATTAGADDWGVTLRAGGFFPRAESNLYRDDIDLYHVEKKDFRGATGGLEVNAILARNFEVGIHVDGYGRDNDTSYRDYVRTEDGSEITQTLRLAIIPTGVSFRLVPTSRHVPVAPYLAVGGDAIFWNYEEEGDLIDFRSNDQDVHIYEDHFVSNGVAFGLHAAAGLRVYFSDDVAIEGEVRYLWAQKPEMKGDFEQSAAEDKNYIDLSGLSATIGFHVRF